MKPAAPQASWLRSSMCSSDACVEIAHLWDGTVALRDSKNPGKAAHVFSADEWEAFVSGVKNGEFDFARS
jgi:hypothetical protein